MGQFSLIKKGLDTHTRNRSLDALGALVVAVLRTLLSALACLFASAMGWNTAVFWVVIPCVFVFTFVRVYFKNRAKTMRKS